MTYLEKIHEDVHEYHALWNQRDDQTDQNFAITNEGPPLEVVQEYDDLIKKEHQSLSMAKFIPHNFNAVAKHSYSDENIFNINNPEEMFAPLIFCRRHFVYFGDQVQELQYNDTDLMQLTDGGKLYTTSAKFTSAYPELKVEFLVKEATKTAPAVYKQISLTKWYHGCHYKRCFQNREDFAVAPQGLLQQLTGDAKEVAKAQLGLVDRWLVAVVNEDQRQRQQTSASGSGGVGTPYNLDSGAYEAVGVAGTSIAGRDNFTAVDIGNAILDFHENTCDPGIDCRTAAELQKAKSKNATTPASTAYQNKVAKVINDAIGPVLRKELFDLKVSAIIRHLGHLGHNRFVFSFSCLLYL